MRSFVAGNGVSRLQTSLPELQKYGPVYGCNALYREFEPDYLVAVDASMVLEIDKAGYQHTHEVWTNVASQLKGLTDLNYFTPRLGWSSGPSALYLAAKHGAKELYMLGFDFIGNCGLLNNVYANTENYRKTTDQATYFGNWQRQVEEAIKKYHFIKFVRVVGDSHSYSLDHNMQNYSEISYEEFHTLRDTWEKRR